MTAHGIEMTTDQHALVGSTVIVSAGVAPASRSIMTYGEQKQESSLQGSDGAEGVGSS